MKTHLGLFFVLPFSTALLLYLLIVALSLVLYAKIVEAMRVPVTTGAEGVIGQIVTTEPDGSIHWEISTEEYEEMRRRLLES